MKSIEHDIEEYLPGAWFDPYTANGFDYPDLDDLEYRAYASLMGWSIVEVH